MKYTFSIPNPFERFVKVEILLATAPSSREFDLQLPSWRPGRYELGNFAKNVRGFRAVDANGNTLDWTKITKDCWRINNGASPVTIHYDYYANQPDAGGCYADHDQLYINPVHCCMYVPERINDPCEVHLKVPHDWKVATGMKLLSPLVATAKSFDHLADSPLIASPSLQHGSYTVDDITFNIWIQGECNPDWLRIIRDFEGFTVKQKAMMKEFPFSEYHFLVQLLPHVFYHGVEHTNSTVLALGPGHNLMQPALYNDFLGVASHELFHAWNVKTIRPQEMLPYDFTGENYAETGYVYEGVTTYYGDLFLARSGFFNLNGLLDEYSARLQKHMDNPGRLNQSVSQSSFDTWLDGYVPGIPGKKVSIYDEGCLIAWMLDFMIRSSTDCASSLDQVMQSLYFGIAKKGKGYSKEDFKHLCEVAAGRKFDEFFNQYVYQSASFENILPEILSLAGLSIIEKPAAAAHERLLGMKTEQRGSNTFALSTYPGSPAAMGGLVRDDEIVAVNNIRVENNLSDLVSAQANDRRELSLYISSGKRIRKVTLALQQRAWFNKYSIVANEEITAAQLRFRQGWLMG